MKKTTISLGLMSIALVLTNCATNEDPMSYSARRQGEEFAICASAATRTAVDGTNADNTCWVADDRITVLHAPTGSAEYTNDGAFAIAAEDVATGRFAGTLGGAIAEVESYDWLAIYPHVDANAALATGAANVEIATVQTQTGNNSRAHICGANAPLIGTATAVSGSTQPSIRMQHLTTLLKIVVTNSKAEPITVSQIRFSTSSKAISGSFTRIASTGALSGYWAKYVVLTVADGTPIAAGASAEFYMTAAPFTAPTGGEILTVVITATDGSTYTKDAVLAQSTSLAAGKINTLNVSVKAQYYNRFQDTVTAGKYLITSTLKTETKPLVMNTTGKPSAAPADDLSAQYEGADDRFVADATTYGHQIDIYRNNENASYPFYLKSVAENTTMGAGFGNITWSSSVNYIYFKFTKNIHYEGESSIAYDIQNAAGVSIKYDPTTDTFKPGGSEGVRLYKLDTTN